MHKHLRTAGVIAGIILIVFGTASIVMGAAGRDTVRSNLGDEKIVGTPDMTPGATKKAIAEAGLKGVSAPSCSVAGKVVDNGGAARCFAQYMRIHALEATGGQVYAEMGRFLDAKGTPTNDEQAAAIDARTKQPVENGKRNLWVNETALATALNTSYFAENVALFSVVMGIALLFTGIGFLVLTLSLGRPVAARKEEDVPPPAATPVLAG